MKQFLAGFGFGLSYLAVVLLVWQDADDESRKLQEQAFTSWQRGYEFAEAKHKRPTSSECAAWWFGEDAVLSVKKREVICGKK